MQAVVSILSCLHSLLINEKVHRDNHDKSPQMRFQPATKQKL
jgi:hypothetical protein